LNHASNGQAMTEYISEMPFDVNVCRVLQEHRYDSLE